MKPVSPTERPPLTMKIVNGEASEKFRLSSNRIGWVHSLADKEGASFNLVLRDSLGRVMFERKNCKVETREFGELMNIDGHIGEEIEVSLEDVKGADEISLFLN